MIAVSIYISRCITKINNKVKNIEIKYQTYYFFNDIINIKKVNPNNIKMDEKSYKDALTYYIRYVKIKDLKYVKISCLNPHFQQMYTLKKLIELKISC